MCRVTICIFALLHSHFGPMVSPSPSFFTQFFVISIVSDWCVLASFSLYLSLCFLRLKYGTHTYARSRRRTHTQNEIYTMLIADGDLFMQAAAMAAAAMSLHYVCVQKVVRPNTIESVPASIRYRGGVLATATTANLFSYCAEGAAENENNKNKWTIGCWLLG